MSKLWIYGCSFSEPFGIEKHGPIFDKEGFRVFTEDFWGTHLARRMDCEIKCKSISGIGWNYINEKIDEDFGYWQQSDTIIVSPSFFSRVTFEETVERNIQGSHAEIFKDWDSILMLNLNRWKSKINSLQSLGMNVHTWIVEDHPAARTVNNLILADGRYCWKEWMDCHLEYWTDPTREKYPQGDWHFNRQGHCAVADIMYDQVTQ